MLDAESEAKEIQQKQEEEKPARMVLEPGHSRRLYTGKTRASCLTI
jgi:hypothetical protein